MVSAPDREMRDALHRRFAQPRSVGRNSGFSGPAPWAESVGPMRPRFPAGKQPLRHVDRVVVRTGGDSALRRTRESVRTPTVPSSRDRAQVSIGVCCSRSIYPNQSEELEPYLPTCRHLVHVPSRARGKYPARQTRFLKVAHHIGHIIRSDSQESSCIRSSEEKARSMPLLRDQQRQCPYQGRGYQRSDVTSHARPNLERMTIGLVSVDICTLPRRCPLPPQHVVAREP